MLPPIENVFVNEINVDQKSPIIIQGEISDKMYLIKKGCVRVWYKQKGKEMTTQLLMEGTILGSMESFLYNEPSPLNADSIEPTQLAYITKDQLDHHLSNNISMRDSFYQVLLHRVLKHTRKLVFLIKSKPEERYHSLVAEFPDIMHRVPHHYIASYLGITTVSLSRIRGRK